jgi:hypothetical protein
VKDDSRGGGSTPYIYSRRKLVGELPAMADGWEWNARGG